MILREVLLEAGIVPPKNSDIDDSGISTGKYADSHEIAIAFRNSDVSTAKTNIVLTDINLTERDKLLIFPITSVFESAVSIARVFIRHGVYPDYNDIGSYKIDGNMVRWGEDCDIGYGTRIDSFSEIGNNVSIGNNTIAAKIGNGLEFNGSNAIQVKLGAGLKFDDTQGVQAITIDNKVEEVYNLIPLTKLRSLYVSFNTL